MGNKTQEALATILNDSPLLSFKLWCFKVTETGRFLTEDYAAD